MSDFEITPEHVDKMMNYLRIFHPDKPQTPEYARAFLEYLKATYREIALADPKELDKIFEEFENSKSS